MAKTRMADQSAPRDMVSEPLIPPPTAGLEHDSLPRPGDRIEVRIPAHAEYVRVVRLVVTGVASRLAFSVDDIEDIKLAVTEACNNAILHASPQNAADKLPVVVVQFAPRREALEILVSDEGRVAPPGLPEAATRPLTHDSTADLPESGWGLLLIQALMDEVEHHTGPTSDTTVRMVKYVPAHAEDR